jgi:hypothetical protein
MSFFLGAVEGLSRNLDKGLQNSLKKTEERIEKASLRESLDRKEKRKNLREQEQAVEEVLDGIAGFIDKTKLPNGVTVYDAAAAIFANQAGGSVARGSTLVSALTESELKGRSPDLILDQVKATGMSPSDINKQFLTFPDLTPSTPVMGAGFLKKKDLTADIMAAVDEPALPTAPTDTADFGMARFDLTKTSQAIAAKQAEESGDVALQQARLTLEKTQKEIAEMGGLGETAQRLYLKNALKTAANLKDVPLVDGEVVFHTSAEKFQNNKDAVAFALQGATQYFIDTGTMGKTSGKNSILGFISTNGGYLSTSGQAAIKDGNFDPDGMEVGKIYSYKFGGQNMNGLWIGNEMIPVTGIAR